MTITVIATPSVRADQLKLVVAERGLQWSRVGHVTATTTLADAIMVVPAKVAAEFSQGIVRPMTSKAAAGGVYSALRDSKGIVANATYVPVGEAATAGAVGAATAGGAVAAGAALTIAAPLVLMTAPSVNRRANRFARTS